jgi:2-hydroxy-3-oxopropionate reductase
MQAKDMSIVLESARQYGVPLPSAALHTQLFNAMVETGRGNNDNSAVVAILEMLAGVELEEGGF